MPSLTGLGILSFPFPGTAVPGYRLFRPYGTGSARLDIVPFYRRRISSAACLNSSSNLELPSHLGYLVTAYIFTGVRGSFACMTRLARMVVPGLPHHVTQRGNRREAIFFE
ncbi:MAG TPA: hypothetical protein VH325_14115, partial [Bryobacteraceae bacterium]|nr:hypothetical protein [Bryobacteraceae bacterium]